jgi:Cd2+/Zn2+-exporting ATPase
MVTAAIGAATIGHWEEGAILLFLFSLGNALEHYAMGRTTRAVRALMELSPDEALVVRDGREQRLHVRELRLGDVVIVKPGERIAADGDILSGESAIDQSPITGESMPVNKTIGEPVFAGTINGRGALRISVTRLAHESTLAKIIKIVQEAQADKSTTQRFTDRFEGAYAIGVISASVLYLAALTLIGGFSFEDAFYRSMILLVVASPCALVISTPASTLSALANAARNGVLVKGAAHLENLGSVKVVAFDKTGTLTVGRPRLTDIVPLAGVTEAELLAVAATAERSSEHPLAQAVVNGARQRGVEPGEAGALEAVTGQGIVVKEHERTVFVGNEALFAGYGITLAPTARETADRLREDGKTIMYVGVREPAGDTATWGVLAVADTVRPVARQVVARLKELGIEHTVMLTGDNERAAHAIGRLTGVDEIHAGLLPEEKLTVIEDLGRRYGSVIMVGDGVNDAPALAAATIGVAMGAAGTDVALETADVVLMSDDLTKLPYAIELSRKARRIIRQNLGFALSVIAVLVSGTLLGLTSLPLGVIGHEGSTIVVVGNGLRLLRGVRKQPQPVERRELALAGD